MYRAGFEFRCAVIVGLFLSACAWGSAIAADAKLQCNLPTDQSANLPRTVAIASNLPGTGAHSMASGLSAVASKVTPIAAKVQPYNGPNAWMPLLESGEVEFGFINILDAHMAATGTGNYRRLIQLFASLRAAFFPSPAASWCAISRRLNGRAI